MAGNDQKTPLGRNLNRMAIHRALDAIQITGRSLPCTVASRAGSIVTVNFAITSPFTLPQVTIPIGSSEYIRLPLAAGCPGVAAAMDARLGGLTGLGSGNANLTDPPNLTALVFFPIGATTFSSYDPTTLGLYGEPNAQIGDKTGASFAHFSPAGIEMVSNGHTLLINSGGIYLDGILFRTHMHDGVETGEGNTGGVIG